MAVPYVHVLNREILGPWAIGLSDEDYVQLIAAMGVGSAPDDPAHRRDHVWTLSAFRRSLRDIQRTSLKDVAFQFISDWRSQLKGGAVPRIVIRAADRWIQAPDPSDIAGILSHPAVGATTVRLDWSCPQADLKWQWPLRVAAFDDDFERLGLAHLLDNDSWPANRLTLPQVLNRDATRVEVLVMRADARAALARLLGLKHRIRAGLLLLVAPLDMRWQEFKPLLQTLLSETQAGAVGVVQRLPEETFAPVFNGWIYQLSHAAPLDIAFGQVFGAGRSLLMLDGRLIKAAELTRAAMAISGRLERMVRSMERTLPNESVTRVRATWKRSKPPRELAREIRVRAEAGDISFESEAAGASMISELEADTKAVEHALAVEEAPRFLQGDLFQFSGSEPMRETRGLLLEVRHALDVYIDAQGLAGVTADVPIPDEDIDWGERESVSLQIMLAEPNQWADPLLGTLELPRYGRSTTHRFTFTPTKAGAFQARVTLYYRGRILQTALLETEVVTSLAGLAKRDEAGLALKVEAAIRRSFATLGERRRFDACIVCNHTVVRQAALTAAGKDGAYISSLSGVDTAIANINHLLTQVAQDAARYRKGLTSKDNADLLRRLAVQGNALYRHIVVDYIDRSTAAKAIRDADYLQIVTMEPDAIVPLEFVYDYPVPADDAPVCSHARNALKGGTCPKSCRPTSSPADRVCPLGFWGLRKVIERHLHVPELPKTAKVIASEPIDGRDELSLKGETLVGVSREVGAAGERKLLTTLKRLRKPGVIQAGTWREWTAAVAKRKPVMLVTLPHAEGAALDISLEIGGDAQKSVYIDGSYVHVEGTLPPLTLLLGCDTANTGDTEAYLRHVQVFRQADAALVLGTVATVLGKHAAGMAERLIECLDAAFRAKPGRFGEALLQAKRTAVADSEMIGLCLAAFGDADWRIVPDSE